MVLPIADAKHSPASLADISLALDDDIGDVMLGGGRPARQERTGEKVLLHGSMAELSVADGTSP